MAGFPFGGGQQQRGDGDMPSSDLGFFLYSGRGARRSEEAAGYTRGFELYQIQREHGQLYSTSGFPDDLAPAAGSRAIGGGVSCQDCGNHAKKDCAHLRCRTCCKSRGFPCPTHVKSTWVPAAKRRDRQQQLLAAAAATGGDQLRRRVGEPSGGGESSKRPRELATACTRIATATTTYGGTVIRGSLPPEVSAEAMFRCVRVSPVDEADDEYAYQTTVSIAGHVFKGILYDHGADADADHHPSSSSSRCHLLLHGDGSSSHNATAGKAAAAAAASTTPAELLDPYPAPLSSFIAAGTQFFPQSHRP